VFKTKKKPTLLIVMYVSAFKMRNIQKNLVDCYKDHLENCDIYYVNLFMSKALSICAQYKWDYVIFHSSLLSLRFNRKRFTSLVDENSQWLIKLNARSKAVTVQDEFVHMDLVCDFINKYDVSHVFSVAPEQEFSNLYPTVDFSKVAFHRVLTGYIDYKTVSLVERRGKSTEQRPFLIGYRVVSTPQWGSFNLKKREIADVFVSECSKRGYVHDIKIGEQHFLHGNSWVLHLTKCRATIGIEGGANILDWNGSFSEKIKAMLASGVAFDRDYLVEIESNIPKIDLKALSPRHLEACMTRTCQILVEGHYNGILKPWVHYIPLKPDYSNLDEVFDALEDSEKIKKITDNAFNDIVRSRLYGYDVFAKFVIKSIEAFPLISGANDQGVKLESSIPMLLSSRLFLSNLKSTLIAGGYHMLKLINIR